MSLVHCSLLFLRPFNIARNFNEQQLKSKFFSSGPCFNCRSLKNENTHKTSEGFCVLKSDIPCDSGSVWSTMALYVFSLHVPLSFGGLSVVAQLLHEPVLNPQTEALSILGIQTVELFGMLQLLRYIGKPQYNFCSFFQANKLSKERNWLWASAFGFGFLVLSVFVTSLIADRLIGPRDVNNLTIKEILLSGSISKTACVLVYCIVIPLLEETAYRGFLLTSLASRMKWQQAVIV